MFIGNFYFVLEKKNCKDKLYNMRWEVLFFAIPMFLNPPENRSQELLFQLPKEFKRICKLTVLNFFPTLTVVTITTTSSYPFSKLTPLILWGSIKLKMVKLTYGTMDKELDESVIKTTTTTITRERMKWFSSISFFRRPYFLIEISTCFSFVPLC